MSELGRNCSPKLNVCPGKANLSVCVYGCPILYFHYVLYRSRFSHLIFYFSRACAIRLGYDFCANFL